MSTSELPSKVELPKVEPLFCPQCGNIDWVPVLRLDERTPAPDGPVRTLRCVVCEANPVYVRWITDKRRWQVVPAPLLTVTPARAPKAPPVPDAP